MISPKSVEHYADKLRKQKREHPDDSLYPFVVGVIDTLVNGVMDEPLTDVRNVIDALAIVRDEPAK